MKIRPIVRKKRNRLREGKGFSKGELRAVGIDFKQALKLKIPIDIRRKTKHEDNIKTLNHHLRSLKSPKPSKKRKSHAG
ncbi:MAG: ribosomal protein L13e [Candidatus Bathyarchaeota archaeon]|nr:ribosomal protein L13e [Candidatus Bathyarchaeota archaeon]